MLRRSHTDLKMTTYVLWCIRQEYKSQTANAKRERLKALRDPKEMFS